MSLNLQGQFGAAGPATRLPFFGNPTLVGEAFQFFGKEAMDTLHEAGNESTSSGSRAIRLALSMCSDIYRDHPAERQTIALTHCRRVAISSYCLLRYAHNCFTPDDGRDVMIAALLHDRFHKAKIEIPTDELSRLNDSFDNTVFNNILAITKLENDTPFLEFFGNIGREIATQSEIIVPANIPVLVFALSHQLERYHDSKNPPESAQKKLLELSIGLTAARIDDAISGRRQKSIVGFINEDPRGQSFSQGYEETLRSNLPRETFDKLKLTPTKNPALAPTVK